MIDALIAGRVYGQPSERTGKTGKRFVVAKLRAAVDGSDTVFINVVAFADSAQSALLALGDGDSAAVTGPLKIGVWQDKEGNHRPALDLVAHQVQTSYSVTKKRKAMQRESNVSGDAPATPYGRPHDEAWRAMAPRDRSSPGDFEPLDF